MGKIRAWTLVALTSLFLAGNLLLDLDYDYFYYGITTWYPGYFITSPSFYGYYFPSNLVYFKMDVGGTLKRLYLNAFIFVPLTILLVVLSVNHLLKIKRKLSGSNANS